MFVKSTEGKYYAVSALESLWASEGQDYGQLKGGETVKLQRGEVDRAVMESGRPFPSAPDTYVLEQIDERCKSSSYARVPVLAWVVIPERGTLPITSEGINHGLERTVPVLMPSGEIVVAKDCTYADEDCFLSEQRSARGAA